MNYADQVMNWLKELGFTHCFFVAGGNSMHLLNSARQNMECVPFVHEVSAGIAAEYFNEARAEGLRAFVLVTAGPGMTNLVTALAGAYLESRELLVLGGQVKSTDLATGGLRQRGIQEIDGVSIARPITKCSLRIEQPISKKTFVDAVVAGVSDRPGPVFLEFCLDAQGAPATGDDGSVSNDAMSPTVMQTKSSDLVDAVAILAGSQKPVLLLGGGVARSSMSRLLPLIEASGIPVMTTWNGADRISSDHPQYLGRPNTWGQRSSNILIQQADVVVAVGTRLGLQQSGFNWQEFVADGKILHVDIDETELTKGHPTTALAIHADANDFLEKLLVEIGNSKNVAWSSWLLEARKVRASLPLSEPVNGYHEGFVNPFDFALQLSTICNESDQIVPCSSGGAFTVMMQAFNQKFGQTVITDKGLASMGYGLAGAIGTSLSHQDRKTVLVEGDGGFAQNLQELATVDVQQLNLKIFIFANEGYASIRMTQRNYFDGAYLGCDINTGLGFPQWEKLASAYGLSCLTVTPNWLDNRNFLDAWHSEKPVLFIVPVHPEQTYYPKISSQVTPSGGMMSAPLHLMTPEIS
jgi:acetolactate synthase I/II/III large subunit